MRERLPLVLRSGRLDLVVLTYEWLETVAKGSPRASLGFTDPFDFLADSPGLIEVRLAQLRADRTTEPWLLRAIVLRETEEAVGYINFHDRPDSRGMVEIGYQIVPEMRRRGLAREAAKQMWRWAAANGARVFRASVAPDNLASLKLIESEGFKRVGEQIDEIDGLEFVYERNAN